MQRAPRSSAGRQDGSGLPSWDGTARGRAAFAELGCHDSGTIGEVLNDSNCLSNEPERRRLMMPARSRGYDLSEFSLVGRTDPMIAC
eukprot:766647-Hanusia_phi.AAC.5